MLFTLLLLCWILPSFGLEENCKLAFNGSEWLEKQLYDGVRLTNYTIISVKEQGSYSYVYIGPSKTPNVSSGIGKKEKSPSAASVPWICYGSGCSKTPKSNKMKMMM